MKVNKQNLILRILTFPVKLIFLLLWHNIVGTVVAIRWIFYGSEEVYFGRNGRKSISEVLRQNEIIIKNLNK